MKENNKKGFSLALAMGLVIIMSLLALTILEYIIPFSRDIKGVENSSIAYYQADSGIEAGLYNIYERNNSGTIDNRTEYSTGFTLSGITYSYNTISSGAILPPSGEGNSDYDNDWNTISSGNPIQLFIGEGNITNNLKVAFRVPDLDRSILTNESLSGAALPVVNWQLSSENNTLNASGSWVEADDVLDSDETIAYFNLRNKTGYYSSGSTVGFSSFYNNNCGLSGSGCTLKLSVVNKLETTVPNLVPYLEWILKVHSTNSIPLRYSKIESAGKAYGFKKELEVKVASKTVNQAFDFAVFQ